MSVRGAPTRGASSGGRTALAAMDRRVPDNPRYSHVKSKLDTGLTVDKVKYVTAKEYLRRRDEPYYRITPRQLHDLLSEYERDAGEEVGAMADRRDPDGHGPMVVTHEEEAAPCYDRPYLILDLRTPPEYAQWRVVQARTFPHVLLNQDRMTPELFSFKNKEGTLIILYDSEEKAACDAAQTLLHRGFGNVYVLSGGLQAFHTLHPEHIEGRPPAPPPLSSSQRERRASGSGGLAPTRRYSTGTPSVAGSRLSGGGGGGGAGMRGLSRGSSARSISGSTVIGGTELALRRLSLGSTRGGGGGGGDGCMSQRTTASVAETVISRAAARHGR